MRLLADTGPNVRFWHEADLLRCNTDVCFKRGAYIGVLDQKRKLARFYQLYCFRKSAGEHPNWSRNAREKWLRLKYPTFAAIASTDWFVTCSN